MKIVEKLLGFCYYNINPDHFSYFSIKRVDKMQFAAIIEQSRAEQPYCLKFPDTDSELSYTLNYHSLKKERPP